MVLIKFKKLFILNFSSFLLKWNHIETRICAHNTPCLTHTIIFPCSVNHETLFKFKFGIYSKYFTLYWTCVLSLQVDVTTKYLKLKPTWNLNFNLVQHWWTHAQTKKWCSSSIMGRASKWEEKKNSVYCFADKIPYSNSSMIYDY